MAGTPPHTDHTDHTDHIDHSEDALLCLAVGKLEHSRSVVE